MDNDEALTNAQRATLDFLFAEGTMEDVAQAAFADRLFSGEALLPEPAGVACRLTVNGQTISFTMAGPLVAMPVKPSKKSGRKRDGR
jgi:predicted ester cyclase